MSLPEALPPATTDGLDAYHGAHVCVTGGAGFIGSHLVDALRRCGATVAVLDDLSNGQRANLPADDDGVRFVEGSILDADALGRAIDGASVVFHQAAVASVPRSVREPALYAEVNATGTVRVLDAARTSGVRRVVYAASSSAYGEQPGMPRVETMPPDVRSPYAAAKCSGEYACRAYAACYDLDTVSLRYFNIFGPRQRADSPYAAVIPVFAARMLRGETPMVYGSGEQTRDFTYVANAVRANLLAGAHPTALGGDVLNIACGRRAQLLDLVHQMAALLGVPAHVDHAPPRAGEVTHSLADITRARETIGYEPLISFEDGLARTLAWLRDTIDA